MKSDCRTLSLSLLPSICNADRFPSHLWFNGQYVSWGEQVDKGADPELAWKTLNDAPKEPAGKNA